MSALASRRILFLVADDWLFVLFRLGLARELVAQGCTVGVGCQLSTEAETIAGAGIQVFSIPFARQKLSPAAVWRAGVAVRRLLGSFRPDLVHAVALRPILIGWLASLGKRRPPFVNAVTGLGSLFADKPRTWRLRIARRVVEMLLRRALHHQRAFNVFQNHEDLEQFVAAGYSPRAASFLIRGSGVDTAWTPRPEPPAEAPVVLFVGRLLRDKGVGELLEASAMLRRRQVAHRLRLVGDCDPCNPTSFTEAEVRQWQAAGQAEWLGRRADVLEQMSDAWLVVLPSYREGLPKVLLEAGVAQRAVITCDTVGCRELVTHEVNGLLVPPKAPEDLAAAIERLLKDHALRRALAKRLRELVCREFSLALVNQQLLALYQNALHTCPLPA